MSHLFTHMHLATAMPCSVKVIDFCTFTRIDTQLVPFGAQCSREIAPAIYTG